MPITKAQAVSLLSKFKWRSDKTLNEFTIRPHSIPPFHSVDELSIPDRVFTKKPIFLPGEIPINRLLEQAQEFGIKHPVLMPWATQGDMIGFTFDLLEPLGITVAKSYVHDTLKGDFKLLDEHLSDIETPLELGAPTYTYNEDQQPTFAHNPYIAIDSKSQPSLRIILFGLDIPLLLDNGVKIGIDKATFFQGRDAWDSHNKKNSSSSHEK